MRNPEVSESIPSFDGYKVVHIREYGCRDFADAPDFFEIEIANAAGKQRKFIAQRGDMTIEHIEHADVDGGAWVKSFGLPHPRARELAAMCAAHLADIGKVLGFEVTQTGGEGGA